MAIAHFVKAEVVIDSSFGDQEIFLEGPNFRIEPGYGQQVGGNLFHSFRNFDLNKGQSAVFLGPNSVENIVGRITGSQRSVINGGIRSDIPQANLYLINPHGFLLGPKARLDIGGAFYLSTADQLRLGTSGHFNASQPENSVLISAPPTAFGFLDNTSAKIQIVESDLGTTQNRRFSIVGGEIQVEGGKLRAVSGQINLIGITSNGEVKISSTGLLVDSKISLGNVSLERQTTIDTGKDGAGHIFIRGRDLILNKGSSIIANNSANPNTGLIALEVDKLDLSGGANIDSRTFGPGQGGQIQIRVKGEAKLSDESTIQSSTDTSVSEAGNAGNIVLEAGSLLLENSIISSTTESSGQGGDITLSLQSGIILTESVIQASSIPKGDSVSKAGNAGRIHISAQDIRLTMGSRIDNSTFGTGSGGNIFLSANHELQQQDAFISADSQGIGEAGGIVIEALAVNMWNSYISTAANQADGGNIVMKVQQQLALENSEISATVQGGSGNGGNLLISNPLQVNLTRSQIVANANRGKGGLVLIVTPKSPRLLENSLIEASSDKGLDGDVKIDDLDNMDIVTLPTVFLDASHWIREHCAVRNDADLSEFIIVGRYGLPNAPEDLQSYVPSLRDQ